MMCLCRWSVLVLVFAAGAICPSAVRGEVGDELTDGQTVYVPAYSHIYVGDREFSFKLTVTVSIRNINLKSPIRVTAVDYYESQGDLLERKVKEPLTLKPLESIRYIIPERDKAGGSGANFIVEWDADDFVNAPIIETVMIGTQHQQGISFTSRGRAIRAHR